MKESWPILVGGLALFLFAISQLSAVMQNIFSSKAQGAIQKYTSNIYSAILIGTAITVLLDSSSAVIILVIVFINSKVLTFKQAVGLIMGANIGTVFSSQLIALDIGKYSVIPLLMGLVIGIFSKSKKMKKMGKALLYFGMLFFGLFLMEGSVMPLQHSETFSRWIERVEGNPWEGAIVGGLITLIIQSSSGTVGMAIILGKQQVITAAGGIAIMLGAELGTCSDTLIATINGSYQAIKAGIFHLLFNLTTIIIGLLLFGPFIKLTEYLTQSDEIGNIIANAHLLFNVIGVVLFLPFVDIMIKGLNKLIPDRKTDPINVPNV